MKRSAFSGVFSCLLIASFLPASLSHAQFEGVVETKNLTRDDTGKLLEFVMTMWIKKDMVKVSSSAFGSTPGSTMIYRNDKHAVWILNDEGKTYSTNQYDIEAEGTQPSQPGGADRRYLLRRTLKKKMLLGYPAEQIVITQNGQKTEVWGTKKLQNLSAALSKTLGDRQSGAGEGWAGEIAKMGLYPLVSKTLISGKLAESQEVTRIESRALPQEIFEIPPTYKLQRPDKLLRDLREPKE